MDEEKAQTVKWRAHLSRAHDALVSVQQTIEEKVRHMGKGKYVRILKMARTPTGEEYSRTLAITGAGIMILGAVGFVIYLAMDRGVPALMELLGI